MQRFLLSLFSLFLVTSLSAQTSLVWDGEIDTDWNNAMNWNPNQVPTAADTAVFNMALTVTGATPGTAKMLRLFTGNTVIFDLDLNIGDGATPGNTVELQSGSRLVLENNRTLTITPEAGSNGIQIGSTGTTTVNIKGTATLNITGGRHAINMNNPDAEFVMRGTTNIVTPTGVGVRLVSGTFDNRGGLNITGSTSFGIDNTGTFINTASSTTVISIDGAGADAIRNRVGGTFTNEKDITLDNSSGATVDGICTEGDFINTDNGTITISDMGDDGVEIDGSFDNAGTVNITLKSGAVNSNYGIVVGTAVDAGVLINSSNNSINVDGGDAVGRGILVDDAGSVSNTGTITLTGGDDGGRITTRGIFTNELLATLDLTDGRVNNGGTLTNNGLIVSTRGGSGIFSTGTSNNNAFFSYDGSNTFANGSGTVNEMGISLNQFSARVIDITDGGAVVDIAEVPYTWTYNGVPIGTADATGLLTVDCSLIDNDTINIRPEILDFGSTPIRLRGICAQALPIELTNLEALTMPKSIMIKWQTSVEEANDYMAVERSTDGETFSEIGRVAGAGYSLALNNYELEDELPASGVNYYRLRQVDLDGTANYSEMVSAIFFGETTRVEDQLRVYPTVISRGQSLTADLSNLRDGATHSFRVMDANGRVMENLQLNGGTVSSITISNLSPGIYHFVESNGVLSGVRFIVR